MAKALIAMSGGVDSSVAALLMKKAGYDCIGATMHLYDNETAGIKSRTCCSLDDVTDARMVASAIGIPFYVFNFQDDFEKYVIDDFVACYEKGLTPNPCIECNRYLKFERFYKRALEIGCDCVATGHYARIERDRQSGRYVLKKAVDLSKDQSYVLACMTQEQLAHTRFPLGELTKDETRQIAAEHGFVNARKHDSQDICFVPGGDYAGFIARYTSEGTKPGNFIDESGNVIGRHNGIIHYTIGQRKGLGIASDKPYYVCRIDAENNRVVLTHDADKGSRVLWANHLNFITAEDITEPVRVKAKVRYRHAEQWATAAKTEEDVIKVVFDEPQRAITPGQTVVLYDGDVVLGSGTIKNMDAGKDCLWINYMGSVKNYKIT